MGPVGPVSRWAAPALEIWLQPVSRCEHRVWRAEPRRNPFLTPHTHTQNKTQKASLICRAKLQDIQGYPEKALFCKIKRNPRRGYRELTWKRTAYLCMSACLLCYSSLSRCAPSRLRAPGPSVASRSKGRSCTPSALDSIAARLEGSVVCQPSPDHSDSRNRAEWCIRESAF